jgi:glyoxylase-like metal-dependent hydrolase (beta-lactamase superfamily II)
MRIHHLNCATMCPLSSRLINGTGGWFARAKMVCHCLLIETDDGLVVVDTGIGLDDIRDPKRRLGGGFVNAVSPALDESETALRQVERLGFGRGDVRHIVLTHLDVDHAGGLPDFPDAKVHVFGREHDAGMKRPSFRERERYRPTQWAHGPNWVVHPNAGEAWFGFETVRAIENVGTDVLLVPLHGHTRGHCGVAVKTGGSWLLHCGDAYFSHGEVHGDVPTCPPGLRAFQKIMAIDDAARLRNQDRVRALVSAHGGDIEVFCAHDPNELDALGGESAATKTSSAA